MNTYGFDMIVTMPYGAERPAAQPRAANSMPTLPRPTYRSWAAPTCQASNSPLRARHLERLVGRDWLIVDELHSVPTDLGTKSATVCSFEPRAATYKRPSLPVIERHDATTPGSRNRSPTTKSRSHWFGPSMQIFLGHRLTPLAEPFFAYLLLVATLLGWAWEHYRDAARNDMHNGCSG